MALFSIIVALILEQIKPFAQGRYVALPLKRYALFLEDRFNDGEARHGTVAWVIGVLLPTVAMLLVQWLLFAFEPEWALLLNVGVLYLTMGFRQFSHFFNDIHLALRMGELDRARKLLGQWRGHDVAADQLSSNEVARLAIEEALVASHRYVFAPLLWFIVAGPAGALFYRLGLVFCEQWKRPAHGDFGRWAVRAFALIDWLPARISAAAFAVVGDFEDAVFCWRTQAVSWPDAASGIILASGAGALGVRLGAPISDAGGLLERPELGLGDDADPDFMRSAIGLVWRTMVLCLLLLALFWVASWVGA